MNASKKLKHLTSPTLKGTVLSLDSRLFVREVIRKGFYAASRALSNKLNISVQGVIQGMEIIEEAIKEGYLKRENGRIIITEKGRSLDL